MPGPISDSYQGPKDGSVPSWMDEPSQPTKSLLIWHFNYGPYEDPKAMSRVEVPCGTPLWFWL